VLTASSAEEIFCLLSSMKEAQQEAVFSLGPAALYTTFGIRIQLITDPDPGFVITH
jgi:hypothetical protein